MYILIFQYEIPLNLVLCVLLHNFINTRYESSSIIVFVIYLCNVGGVSVECVALGLVGKLNLGTVRDV